jgi:hypothetical protein
LVTVGAYSLPHVLGIQLQQSRQEIDRAIPGATVGYRRDQAKLGRALEVSGEIRETRAATVHTRVDEIRALCDDTIHEDGTAAFNAQALSPRFSFEVEKYRTDSAMIWGTFKWGQFQWGAGGKYHVPYSVTLLEVT